MANQCPKLLSTNDYDNLNLKDENLLKRLENSQHKYNKDDLVMITEDKSNNLYWLENDNDNAGLNHILGEHKQDFINKGVKEEDIPILLHNAYRSDNLVGTIGRDRPVYSVMYNGSELNIAITSGSNGFIVGANPVSNYKKS